jgi:hypothetical protein
LKAFVFITMDMYKRQDDGKGPVAHIQENAPYALRTCTPKTTALQIPPTMPLLQRGIPVLLAVPLRLQNLPELHARESVGHDLQRYYMAMPRLRRLERLRQSVNFYSSHKHDFIFDARPQTIAVDDLPGLLPRWIARGNHVLTSIGEEAFELIASLLVMVMVERTYGQQGLGIYAYLTAGLNLVVPGLQQMHRLPRDIQVLELTNYPSTASIFARKDRAAHIQTSDGFFVDVDVSIAGRGQGGSQQDDRRCRRHIPQSKNRGRCLL